MSFLVFFLLLILYRIILFLVVLVLVVTVYDLFISNNDYIKKDN